MWDSWRLAPRCTCIQHNTNGYMDIDISTSCHTYDDPYHTYNATHIPVGFLAMSSSIMPSNSSCVAGPVPSIPCRGGGGLEGWGGGGGGLKVTHTWLVVGACLRLRVWIHMHQWAHIHTHVHTISEHTYTHTNVRVCVYECSLTHAYSHTQEHTRPSAYTRTRQQSVHLIDAICTCASIFFRWVCPRWFLFCWIPAYLHIHLHGGIKQTKQTTHLPSRSTHVQQFLFQNLVSCVCVCACVCTCQGGSRWLRACIPRRSNGANQQI